MADKKPTKKKTLEEYREEVKAKVKAVVKEVAKPKSSMDKEFMPYEKMIESQQKAELEASLITKPIVHITIPAIMETTSAKKIYSPRNLRIQQLTGGRRGK